jgi:preprotein translocase subunit Sec61beta
MASSYQRNLKGDENLSQRGRKRERRSPMPAASAGLLRFFEEETQGIKVRPEFVVVLTVGLILAAVLARVFLPL